MRTTLVAIPILALVGCQSVVQHDDTALIALDIRNTRVVEPGLISSGQPTEEQFAQLAATGYTNVVCLRQDTENGTGWEEGRAKELGLDFVRLPITGSDAMTESNARALADAIARHEAGTAILVCCGSGNRVGGLLALKAHFVDGATADDALALGKRAGMTRTEPAVRSALGL